MWLLQKLYYQGSSETSVGDISNMNIAVNSYSPYIVMTGYTSSYPYTKRYIRDLWVR